MNPHLDAEKLQNAINVIEPRSHVLKFLIKVPLIGTVVKSFRELIHFRSAFLIKRVLAEQGLSNRALFANFAITVFLAWVMSFSWKITGEGAILTLRDPSFLSVFLLILGIVLTVSFLSSLMTCLAIGIGTWRHAKGKAQLIANTPRKQNIFTPKDFETRAAGLHSPVFPDIKMPTKLSPPPALPVMSSALDAYNAIEDKPRPGPRATHVPYSQIEMLQDRFKSGGHADIIFAALLAASQSTDIRGLAIGRYPDGQEDYLIVLAGVETGRIFKVEILRQKLVAVEEATAGQTTPPKPFEYEPLRKFVQNLENPHPAPWGRSG